MGLRVRWQAVSAADTRKEIIAIVQIQKCSYSIAAGRLGWPRCHSFSKSGGVGVVRHKMF